ncbi:unnamed protein product [Parnassius apollo]|uniref:(apollo) hypothetical protein n=1 Tax=Parnassius apollo TaxID=110799 RepID=A0A8S3XH05_PARAO|nr:unnamed protein product [Parnassius apollo]
MLKHPDVVKQPLKKTIFFTNCRNFLRTGALEIKKRYNMEDPVLSKLQALGPASALSNDFRIHVPTLMPLMEGVPRIIASFDDTKKQQIDDQWRILSIAKARHPAELKNTTEPDELWEMLHKTEDFFELASFALAVLAMPHANADCERVFSKTNLIKTDLRNRLITDTVNGTLLASESAKGPNRKGNCVNFEPSKEMYARMTAEKLYSKNKDDFTNIPDVEYN